jgi:capsular exopolysaccharide synthesis family protein
MSLPQLPSGPSDARPDPRFPLPESNFASVRPYYPEPVPGEPESGGLLDVWQSVRRRKQIIVICCFVGGVLGLLSTLPQTPVYQAGASLEIQPINQDFLQMRNVNPTNEGGGDYYQDYDIQTQVQILESKTLQDRVVRKLTKEKHYAVTDRGRIDQWREALGISVPGSAVARALAFTASTLKVRAKPNTRLLDISCDSTDPQMASDFVNTLTSEYADQSLEARWQTTQRTGEWLTRQMEDVRIKLERSEEALQTYARQTGLMFTSEKDNIAEAKLRQMQDELGRATADRIAKQSKYELGTKSSPDSVGEVLDDATLRDYQSKLTELRRQVSDLSLNFTDNYPRVKKAQGQIAILEAAFDKVRANIIYRLNTDYQVALQREKLLGANYASQAELVNQQADKVTHYNILKHEVDSGRQLYDSMLQRVKEASIASALRASNVRVVDAADIPSAPYKPNSVFNTGVGLFGGLFVGVWAAVMRSRVDRSLQDPSQANLHLGIPLLGLIPAARLSRMRLPSLLKPERAGTPHPGSLGSPERLELISWQQDCSLLAEAFRSASTSLLFSEECNKPSRVIVVTSPQSQEGKTTIASNLGITLAQCNQRVLLVDGDMRRPSLSKIFGVSRAEGLGNLLTDDRRIEEAAFDSVIQSTEIPGLSILPSGPALQGSTSLLHSSRLKLLLDSVKGKYDIVLIDTPPMLQIPDARILGRLADKVVLVVRAARTTREMAQSALQRLAEDGTRATGAILNDWDPKDSGRYSYYRDYHKYYRHYNSKQDVN